MRIESKTPGIITGALSAVTARRKEATKTMKTLTVKQPWASLIVEGIKDIENRTWKCPQKYIGERVLIHASAKPVPGLPCRALTPLQYATVFSAGKLDALIGPNGAIIGSVEIVDCVINHHSVWAERTGTICGNTKKEHAKYSPHPIIYNWVLAKPIKFTEPIPCKGKLSFWDFPFNEEELSKLIR